MKIPLPSSADVGQIEVWVTSRPLRELVRAFGGAWPTGSLAKILSDLDVFSQGVWDFRAGQERHLARAKDFDPALSALVTASCRALGLVDEEPPKNQTYTHILVLGGLIRACVQRPEYAARLSSQVSADHVTALGSFRPLTDIEKSLGLRLGLGTPETEFEAMDAGMRLAFHLATPTETTAHARRYTSAPPSLAIPAKTSSPATQPQPAGTTAPQSTPPATDPAPPGIPAGHPTPAPPDTAPPRQAIPAPPSSPATPPQPSAPMRQQSAHPTHTILAAPSRTPGRRANTADTYRYWAENYSPTGRLLLVTSTAYVPFQHCDALRVLGLEYGCEIDTVGLAPTALPFTPANYLQEVRSAIRSMRALHAVLTG
ncbi:hypothetical protein AB0M43_27740 [Longispora sp. NPDC051575]|uniref:hypothetical protein n=1 Tax=Longispora sp. NPDC051575 TaxID=3154943 RepID=UPI003436ECA4